MATLNTTLSLSSTTVASNSLSLSIADVLNVQNPVTGLSRVSIATGSPTELIAASVSADTYIYIKNTETANHLEVKTAGGTHFGRLRAGEAIFLCVKGSVGIEVQADTAAIVAEYATFTVE